MRRNDREVTDMHEIVGIIKKCDVCRIAMIDRDRPYIVPMNYGYRVHEGTITLYFHSANEGRKIDSMKANPHVCVEMDCGHELVVGNAACSYSMNYESVIGNGVVEFIDEMDEKKEALSLLMKKYTGKTGFSFDETMVKHITVFKIVVRDMVGKKH